MDLSTLQANKKKKLYTQTATYREQPVFFGLDYAKKGAAGKVRINYSTFGAQMPGRSFNSTDYRYGFNGMEKTDEISGSGNHYTAEFWEYDPRTARRWNIDPVVKPWESSYATFLGNPILFIDPNGDDPSTDVTKNEDGTYKVVGGDLNDGNKGIYVVDNNGSRTGEKIGESLTMYSFYNEDSQDGAGQTGWKGTINPNSTESRDLVNNFMKEAGGLSLLDYMPNATDGKKYDFKRNGDPENNDREFHHRGSLFGKGKDGTPIYASARDAGNFAAGYIAGVKDLSWAGARTGFDGLEFGKSLLKGHLVFGEGSQSTLAQRAGFNLGKPIGQAKTQERNFQKAIQKWPTGPKY
ncbi:MAG: hypothetical protein M3Q58_08875 [Bacteroidota bacterium]|nr:hypothetical protein [Bacteroidota bacterium]